MTLARRRRATTRARPAQCRAPGPRRLAAGRLIKLLRRVIIFSRWPAARASGAGIRQHSRVLPRELLFARHSICYFFAPPPPPPLVYLLTWPREQVASAENRTHDTQRLVRLVNYSRTSRRGEYCVSECSRCEWAWLARKKLARSHLNMSLCVVDAHANRATTSAAEKQVRLAAGFWRNVN